MDNEATRQPLDRMTMLPEDRKWDRLLDWVRKNLQQGKKFHPDERLIVFTEYKDTMNYLVERFRREKILRQHYKRYMVARKRRSGRA